MAENFDSKANPVMVPGTNARDNAGFPAQYSAERNAAPVNAVSGY
jgi:hypothetical protein